MLCEAERKSDDIEGYGRFARDGTMFGVIVKKDVSFDPRSDSEVAILHK
jgi:hypothetical protein